MTWFITPNYISTHTEIFSFTWLNENDDRNNKNVLIAEGRLSFSSLFEMQIYIENVSNEWITLFTVWSVTPSDALFSTRWSNKYKLKLCMNPPELVLLFINLLNCWERMVSCVFALAQSRNKSYGVTLRWRTWMTSGSSEDWETIKHRKDLYRD